MLPLLSELSHHPGEGQAPSSEAGDASSKADLGSGGTGSGPTVTSTEPPPPPIRGACSKSRGVAGDVGRDDLGHGDLRLADEPEEKLEPARAVAEVEMEDAGLAAEHPPDPALGRQAGDLVERRLRGAVVAHGDLAGADDLVDEDEVGADAPGQGPDRDLVGPREDEGRDALESRGPGPWPGARSCGG